MRWECLGQDQIFALMDTYSPVQIAALVAGLSPEEASDYTNSDGETKWSISHGELPQLFPPKKTVQSCNYRRTPACHKAWP